VDGVLYDNKQQISRKHFKQFAQVDVVTISYLTSNPAVSRLAAEDFDNTFRNASSYAAFAAFLVIPPSVALWGLIFITSVLLQPRPDLFEKKKRKRKQKQES
jgi:hypothetical protein